MKYVIDLDDDSHDKFDELADNVITIKVINQYREDLSEHKCVELFLSKNAMLGMGTELIRLAHNFRPGKHIHLIPVSEEMEVQRMGVFVTPDSSEMIICCENAKCIDEY